MLLRYEFLTAVDANFMLLYAVWPCVRLHIKRNSYINVRIYFTVHFKLLSKLRTARS